MIAVAILVFLIAWNVLVGIFEGIDSIFHAIGETRFGQFVQQLYGVLLLGSIAAVFIWGIGTLIYRLVLKGIEMYSESPGIVPL